MAKHALSTHNHILQAVPAAVPGKTDVNAIPQDDNDDDDDDDDDLLEHRQPSKKPKATAPPLFSPPVFTSPLNFPLLAPPVGLPPGFLPMGLPPGLPPGFQVSKDGVVEQRVSSGSETPGQEPFTEKGTRLVYTEVDVQPEEKRAMSQRYAYDDGDA